MQVRRELDIFFVALTFLTRLPAPAFARFEAEYMQRASRYYPLVGALVGLLCALVYHLAVTAFSHELAILISMIAGLLITGCFHEDGFADFCDGFGGGWTAEQTLNIMKDSRLGTYGAAGLLAMLAMKFLLLCQLPTSLILPTLVFSHSVSRFLAVSLIYSYPYAQLDQLSKVKPLATELQFNELLLAAATTLIFSLWLDIALVVMLAVILLLFRHQFASYLIRRIGGYTGDCLGAAQQLSEVFTLMLIVSQFS
jgi:adenosylcobinamide-GDP ribazoletransferase